METSLFISDKKEIFSVLLLSDFHVGRNLAEKRLFELEKLQLIEKLAEKKEIKVVLVLGDLIEGFTEKNKEYLFSPQIFQDQAGDFCESLPRFGVPVFYITGDHDVVEIDGVRYNASNYLKRSDLIYLGHNEASVCINNYRVLMAHKLTGLKNDSKQVAKNFIRYKTTDKYGNDIDWTYDIVAKGHFHSQRQITYKGVFYTAVPSFVNVINGYNFERGMMPGCKILNLHNYDGVKSVSEEIYFFDKDVLEDVPVLVKHF